MKKLMFAFGIIVILYSLIGCKSDREKEVERLRNESVDIVVNASVKMLGEGMISQEQFTEINDEYSKIFMDSAELGYQYAVHIKKIATDKSYRAQFENPTQQETDDVNDENPSKDVQKSEEAILSSIKEFAINEYPNDKEMQNYTYSQQLKAYQYMIKVNDLEVLKFSEREYPNDYTMQKHTYDNQLNAKRYMEKVSDSEVKSFSLKKYPRDYTMQKYTYDQQLNAKHYMGAVDNKSAKNKAIREYPNDYTMQKYSYDRLAN